MDKRPWKKKGAALDLPSLSMRRLVVLLAACSPLLLLPSRAPISGRIQTEVGERQLIARSWPALHDAIFHGIDGAYWRPTVFFLHSVDAWLFDENALPFRLTNLALHVLNVVFVAALLRAV